MEQLTKILKKYSLWLFSIFVVILAFVLFWIAGVLANQNIEYEQNTDDLLKQNANNERTLYDNTQQVNNLKAKIQANENIRFILLGVAYSLLSALIFAYAYSWIVEKHNLQIISKEVADQVQETIYQQVKQKFIEIVPDNYFPPATEPDSRFNEILLQNLVSSSLYLFKGVTGRHIPNYLKKTKYSSFTTLKILLLDPKNEGYLSCYCEERYGRTALNDNEQNLIHEVKEEIKSAITELHKVSNIVPVQIGFHQGPIFYRTEIFDETILISYFIGAATPYPPTYQYEKGTIYYEAFLKDFNQAFINSRVTLLFDNKSNDEELKASLDIVFT